MIGKGGKKKIPAPIKLARGTFRVDRDGQQVVFDLGMPVKPEGLPPFASAKWDEIVPLIDKFKILNEADADFLVAYCMAWQEFHDATEDIAKNGLIAISEKGAPYQNPAVGIRHKAMDFIRRYGSEFGLSPIARANVKVNPQQDGKSPKERFFKQA